jgi:hypothetical protein
MRVLYVVAAVTLVSVIFGSTAATAQVINMQDVAQALGVKCEYCHARMGQSNAQSDVQRDSQSNAQPAAQQTPTPSRVEIGRAMIAMTRDINEKILLATGKPATEATRVTCITCHRGVPIPGQLADILTRTALDKGPDAAVSQYRDLRAQFYGRQSYDFGEESLLTAAQQVVRVKPASSIPLLRLNLEFYPRSVRSYAQIAFAYTRALDDESAISTLEKALEIEPENGTIRGQLEQLKSYRRKR